MADDIFREHSLDDIINGIVSGVNKAADAIQGLKKISKTKIEVELKERGFKGFQEDADKAYETLQRFEQLKLRKGMSNYYTSQETALQNLTEAYNNYAEAERAGLSDKFSKPGSVVQWFNAYKALGGEVSKVNSEIAETAQALEKTAISKGGGKNYPYTQANFEALFEQMDEMKNLRFDMTEFSTNFGVIPKAIKKAGDEAAKAAEKIDIPLEKLIPTEAVQARIKQLEEMIGKEGGAINKIWKKMNAKNEIGKDEAKNYYAAIKELQAYYDAEGEGRKVAEEYSKYVGDRAIGYGFTKYTYTEQKQPSYVTEFKRVLEKQMNNVRKVAEKEYEELMKGGGGSNAKSIARESTAQHEASGKALREEAQATEELTKKQNELAAAKKKASAQGGPGSDGTQRQIEEQQDLQKELEKTEKAAEKTNDALEGKSGKPKSTQATPSESSGTAKAFERTAESANRATDAVNRYQQALEKSYAIEGKNNRTPAYNQLKDKYAEYLKYFGPDGADRGKSIKDMSDEGREAAYAYLKSYQEAVKAGVAENRIKAYTAKDLGIEDSAALASMISDYENVFKELSTSFEEAGQEISEGAEKIEAAKKKAVQGTPTPARGPRLGETIEEEAEQIRQGAERMEEAADRTEEAAEKAKAAQEKVEEATAGQAGTQSESALKAGDNAQQQGEKIAAASDAIADSQQKIGESAQQAAQRVTESMEQAVNSVNKYREVLNQTFETEGKRQAGNQLKDAFVVYNDYFGKGGSDVGKSTSEMSEAARTAAYNYAEALKEAMRTKIAESKLATYMIPDFDRKSTAEDVNERFAGIREFIEEQARVLEELGNPKLTEAGIKALNDYMTQWDAIATKQRNKDWNYRTDAGIIDTEAMQRDLDLVKASKEQMISIIRDINTAATDSSSTPIIDSKPVKTEAQAIVDQCQRVLDKCNELNEAGVNTGIKKSITNISTILSDENFDPSKIADKEIVTLAQSFYKIQRATQSEATEMASGIKDYISKLLTDLNVELKSIVGMKFVPGILAGGLDRGNVSTDEHGIVGKGLPYIFKDGKLIQKAADVKLKSGGYKQQEVSNIFDDYTARIEQYRGIGFTSEQIAQVLFGNIHPDEVATILESKLPLDKMVQKIFKIDGMKSILPSDVKISKEWNTRTRDYSAQATVGQGTTAQTPESLATQINGVTTAEQEMGDAGQEAGKKAAEGMEQAGEAARRTGEEVARTAETATQLAASGQATAAPDLTQLDKKVAELQYLYDKVMTIFPLYDDNVNPDMYNIDKFNANEIQRMIELFLQLSDAELKAATGIDDDAYFGQMRAKLQGEVEAIKELKNQIQNTEVGSFEFLELDDYLHTRLVAIYNTIENISNYFNSSLTPSVREFFSLLQGEVSEDYMAKFINNNAGMIDGYIDDIINKGRSAKDVFREMENSFGWDTARFQNLIPADIPTELKGLYESLFSDVENRIKSAEQAAEEFNAQLREIQSTETQVSSGTTSLPSHDKSTFAADIKSLEGYDVANQNFINELIASVVTGQVEYDKAMEEFKSHIVQRKEEIAAEQAKKLRINTELQTFANGTNPILDAMGLAQDEARPDAYGKFIEQIQNESIKGEEAVKKFAEAVGYAYDQVSSAWKKIEEVQVQPAQTPSQEATQTGQEAQSGESSIKAQGDAAEHAAGQNTALADSLRSVAEGEAQAGKAARETASDMHDAQESLDNMNPGEGIQQGTEATTQRMEEIATGEQHMADAGQEAADRITGAMTQVGEAAQGAAEQIRSAQEGMTAGAPVAPDATASMQEATTTAIDQQDHLQQELTETQQSEISAADSATEAGTAIETMGNRMGAAAAQAETLGRNLEQAAGAASGAGSLGGTEQTQGIGNLEQEYTRLLELYSKIQEMRSNHLVNNHELGDKIPSQKSIIEGEGFGDIVKGVYDTDEATQKLNRIKQLIREINDAKKAIQKDPESSAFVEEFSNMGFEKQWEFFEEIAKGSQQGIENLKKLENKYIEITGTFKNGELFDAKKLFGQLGDPQQELHESFGMVDSFYAEQTRSLDSAKEKFVRNFNMLEATIRTYLQSASEKIKEDLREAFKFDDLGLSTFFDVLSSQNFQSDDIQKLVDIESIGKNLSGFRKIKTYGDKILDSSASAPQELIDKYNELFNILRSQNGFGDVDEMLSSLDAKAKELGVTFDETAHKWVELTSSTSTETPGSSGITTLPSQIDEVTAAEQRAGEAGQEMGRQISEGAGQAADSINTVTQAEESLATTTQQAGSTESIDALADANARVGESASDAATQERDLIDTINSGAGTAMENAASGAEAINDSIAPAVERAEGLSSALHDAAGTASELAGATSEIVPESSVDAAKRSAEADTTAAEAARERTAANEALAESERNVDTAESANNGTPMVDSGGMTTGAVSGTGETGAAIASQIEAVNQLSSSIQTLSTNIQAEISAFNQYLGSVADAITSQDTTLSSILTSISDIAEKISSISSSIAQIEQIPIKFDQNTNIDTVIADALQKVKEAFEGLHIDNLGDATSVLSEIKVDPSQTDSIQGLANALDNLSEKVAVINALNANLQFVETLKTQMGDLDSYIAKLTTFEETVRTTLENISGLSQTTEGLIVSVGQTQGVVETSAAQETNAFTELANKIQEVTTAIDNKTNAVRQEAETVDGVVNGEINMFDALLGEINVIITDLGKLDTAIRNLPEIQLKMAEMGEGSTISAGIAQELQSIQDQFANFKVANLAEVGKSIKGISFTTTPSNNVRALSEALSELSTKATELEGLKNLDTSIPIIDKLVQSASDLSTIGRSISNATKYFTELAQAAAKTQGAATGIITSVNEAKASVTENEQNEQGIFDNLLRTLEEVNKAIDAKTSAITAQHSAINAQTSAEVEAFGSLKSEITGIAEKITALSEAIGKIPQIEINMKQGPEGASLSQSIQSELDAVRKVISNYKVKKVQSVQDVMNSFKLKDSQVTTLDNLTNSVSNFTEKLKELGSITTIPIFKTLTEDVEKLKSITQGLKDSTKLINDLSNAAKGMTSATDKMLALGQPVDTKAKQNKAMVASGTDVSQEINAFDTLTQKVNTVTQAVDAKTNAFRQEAEVVDGVAAREVNMLDAIWGEIKYILEELAKLSQAIKNIPEIKLKMSEMNKSSTLSGEIKGELDKIQNAISGFKIDNIEPLKSVIGLLKVNKGQIEGVDNLANSINRLATELSALVAINPENGGTKFIDGLLSHSKDLENLATVLKKSKEEIQQAIQASKAAATPTNDINALRKDEVNKAAKGLQDKGLTTSIQDMYDSNNELVQSIITSQKRVYDEATGRLKSIRKEMLNIKFTDEGSYASKKITQDFAAGSKEYQKYLTDALKDFESLSIKQINKPEMFTDKDMERLTEAKAIIVEINENKNKGIELTAEETKALATYETALQNIRKAEANKKYDEAVGAINKYKEAVDAVNKMEMQREKRKVIDEDAYSKALENMTKAAGEAKAAMIELNDLYKNGRLTSDQISGAGSQYNAIRDGKLKSSIDLANTKAQQAAAEEAKKFNDAIDTYDKVMRRQIQSPELMRKDDREALEAAKAILNEINEKKKNGIQLTEQETAALTRYAKVQSEIHKLDMKNKNTQKKAEINETYKTNMDIIRDYKKAVDELNKLETDKIKGKVIDPDVYREAKEQVDDLKKKAEEALEVIYSLRMGVGREGTTKAQIKRKQYNDAKHLYNDIEQGKLDSSKTLANAKAAKAVNDEYEKQVDIINKAIEARDKFNIMEADRLSGKRYTDQTISEITDELNKTKDAADKAIESIRNLVNLSNDKKQSAETSYQQITTGSSKTENLMSETQRKLDIQKQDRDISDIKKYYDAVKELETLQNRFLSGESVSGKVASQVAKVNKLGEAAKLAQQDLQNFSDNGYAKDLEATLQNIADKFKEISRILQTDMKSNVFDENDPEKAYQALIDNAQKYMEVQEKIRKNAPLTFDEIQFKDKFSKQFEDAIKQAENTMYHISADKLTDKIIELRTKLNEALQEATQQVVQRQSESLGQTIENLGMKTWSQAGVEELQKIKAEYDKIIEKLIDVKNLSEEERKSLQGQLDALQKRTNAYNGNNSPWLQITDKDKSTLKRRMDEWINNNSAAGPKAINEVKALQKELRNIDDKGSLNTITAKFNDIAAAAARAGKTGKSFGALLKKSFSGIARYFMTFTSVYRLIGTFKQAVNIVKELDTNMTNIKKVTEESSATIEKFMRNSFSLADRVGTNASQIQQSVATWLKLGKNFDQAQEAAVASSWLMNVSELDTIDSASTALVSITQAYKDLSFEEILDKLNNVGDHFSSSVSDLATGLQNAAAVLVTQGNDVDEALALLTAGKNHCQYGLVTVRIVHI